MSTGSEKTSVTPVNKMADTSDVGLAMVCYAEDLRAVGQALGAQKFTTVEVKVERDGYRIRAEVDRRDGNASLTAVIKHLLLCFRHSDQKKKESAARFIERRYGREEIERLIECGISRRLDIHAVPDHFGLSHRLRQAGAYLDNLHHATLSEIVVQERWITIRYEDSQGQRKELKQDLQFFYDYWVKMYLRRSARSGPTLASVRPSYLTALETDPAFKGQQTGHRLSGNRQK